MICVRIEEDLDGCIHFKFGAHFVDKMGASTVIDLFAKENKGFLPKKTLSPLPLGQGQVP